MNIGEIVQSNEKTISDKKYLFVECEGSNKVLVLLSAHNQGDKYFLLRSFLENQKFNLLFITDPDNSWYLNDDFGAKYIEIISSVISNYKKEDAYIFGSSMAGYAAINFAVQLNINALVCNPQVNLDLSLDYGWYDLNKNIKKLTSNNKAVALERLLNNTFFDKTMCIVHGHAPIDVTNVELILGSSAPVRKLLVYTLDTDDHAMPFGRDVQKVYEALDLIDRFNKFNLAVEDSNSGISILRENRKKQISKNFDSQFRSLSRKYLDQMLWVKRHEIDKPGVYFFSDVGYYNKKGKISGALIFFDGDTYDCLTTAALNRSQSLKIKNPEKEIIFKNNDEIFENAWVRVPDGGELKLSDSGFIDAVYGETTNSYINWDLIKVYPDIKEGMFISCLLDVEFDQGKITLSLGAFGDSGYYQTNKVIDKSGHYVLSFHIVNINKKHKDAIFSRIYFYPDGSSKKIKINKFLVSDGFYPDTFFWKK